MATKFEDRKGFSTIHLFNEVWRAGKIITKLGKPAHLVIYDPKDIEHHVYGKDALNLKPNSIWRQTPDPELIKIYILTSILDKRENWCFDLTAKPELNSKTKVIYNNGTIKYIEFSGEWDEITIARKYETRPGIFVSINKNIKPIAFKIK